MRENISEIVELYIKGKLSEEEKKAFEFEINSDEELKKEVAYELSIISQYKNKGSEIDKESLDILKKIDKNEIFKNKNNTKRIIYWSLISSMAASFLILIGYNFYTNYVMNNAFNDYYIRVDNNEGLSRGDNDKCKNEIRLEEYYKKEKFKEVIDIYEDSKESNECIDKLLVSITYIETNNFDKAIELLNNETSKGNINPNYQSAYWYLALAYTKAHDKDMAIETLNEIIIQDSYYKSKATQLKARLN